MVIWPWVAGATIQGSRADRWDSEQDVVEQCVLSYGAIASR